MISTSFLTVSMISCASSNIEVKHDLPEWNFPDFPPPDAVNNHDGTVTVSIDWYRDIAKYKISVDQIADEYRKLKEYEK